jgi:hypothetical protein
VRRDDLPVQLVTGAWIWVSGVVAASWVSVLGLLCATKLSTLVFLLHSSFIMGCLWKMNGSSPDVVRNHYAQSNAVSTFSSAILAYGGAALRHAAVGCSACVQSLYFSSSASLFTWEFPVEVTAIDWGIRGGGYFVVCACQSRCCHSFWFPLFGAGILMWTILLFLRLRGAVTGLCGLPLVEHGFVCL